VCALSFSLPLYAFGLSFRWGAGHAIYKKKIKETVFFVDRTARVYLPFLSVCVVAYVLHMYEHISLNMLVHILPVSMWIYRYNHSICMMGWWSTNKRKLWVLPVSRVFYIYLYINKFLILSICDILMVSF